MPLQVHTCCCCYFTHRFFAHRQTMNSPSAESTTVTLLFSDHPNPVSGVTLPLNGTGNQLCSWMEHTWKKYQDDEASEPVWGCFFLKDQDNPEGHRLLPLSWFSQCYSSPAILSQ